MTNILKTEKDTVRILQVADTQDTKYIRKAMVQMLNKAYDSLNPDLVVFTGDNILGNHLLDARFGERQVAEGKEATLEVMKEALSYVLRPVEARSIPFAMIYGNHDDMNPVTKDEQMAIYRSYGFCMEGNTADETLDCDTYVIKIYKENKLFYALYMMDTAWQDEGEKGECHQEIKPEAVEWFRRTNEQLKKENGGEYVPALMFVHIPLPAAKNLLEKCPANHREAVKDSDGNYFKLKTPIAYVALGESISPVKTDNGLFEEIVKAGNVKAVLSGHDHTNAFEGVYKGVHFLQSGCASFRCYGTERARGVRTVDIHSDGTFETSYHTYYELMGKSLKSKVRFFLDSDENEKKKLNLIIATAGTAVLGITAGIVKGVRKK